MKNPLSSILGISQTLPPMSDEKEFESFITQYFNELEDTTSYTIYGRKGQKQNGIDIYSAEKKIVIQCKLKEIRKGTDQQIREKLINDLDRELSQFEKYNNKLPNPFKKFILASTFHSDTHIDDECIKKSNNLLQVEYWSWDKLMKNIPEKFAKDYFEVFLDEIDDYYNPSLIETIDYTALAQSDKPLIDVLYDFLKQSFREIDIFPIEKLIKNYPFKTNKGFYPYYTPFSLTINNENLINLINSLEKEKDSIICLNTEFTNGVNDTPKKLKFITQKLDEHFISSLNNYRGKRSKEIPVLDYKIFNKAESAFGSLDYIDCLKSIKDDSNDLRELFRKAFLHYRLGNSFKAAALFKNIAYQAKRDKKYIWQAIAFFNLSKMKGLIVIERTDKSEFIKLKQYVSETNFESEFNKIRDKTKQKDLFDWIIDAKFHSKQALKIDKTFQKIRKHYYNQLEGGWSSNNNIWFLITEYAQYESFISKNNIVFQHFTEFKELTSKFIEGLIICHSFNENQEGRLVSFNDYMFSVMLFYGKAKEIKLYIKRYKLKELRFLNSDEEEDFSFLNKVENHLTKYDGLEEGLKNHGFNETDSFWYRYDDIFSNMMVLLSYTKLEKNIIQNISEKLLSYLKSTDYLKHNTKSFLALFINTKGKYFSSEILVEFLYLFTTNTNNHEDYLLKAVINQFNIRKERIKLPQEKMRQLTQMCVDKCEVCGKIHLDKLVEGLSQNSNEYFKTEIEKEARVVLKRKFDGEYYYKMAIYGIFEDEDEFFDSFIEFAKPKDKDTSKRPDFWGRRANRFPRVDMLLNLSFKKGIDLTQERFNYFRDIDPYYTWAFDMKNFDYESFEPKWVTEYPYKYYLKKIIQYPIIRIKLLEYLSKNYNKKVEDAFIRLEVYKANC